MDYQKYDQFCSRCKKTSCKGCECNNREHSRVKKAKATAHFLTEHSAPLSVTGNLIA